MFDIVFPAFSRPAWIVSILLAAVYCAGCFLHYRRRGYRSWKRSLLMYGFWLYGLVIAMLIILPLPEITPGFCAEFQVTQRPQTIPLQFLHDIARASGYIRQFSLRALLVSHAFRWAFLNLLAFVPLGIYLRVFTGHGVITATLLAFACTLTFEVTQGTGIFGLYPCPYRHFNVDDIILNTAGGAIGYIVLALGISLIKARRALNAKTSV